MDCREFEVTRGSLQVQCVQGSSIIFLESRAVRRSENPGGGHNLSPWLIFRLTNLPKTGRGALAPLFPLVPTALKERGEFCFCSVFSKILYNSKAAMCCRKPSTCFYIATFFEYDKGPKSGIQDTCLIKFQRVYVCHLKNNSLAIIIISAKYDKF